MVPDRYGDEPEPGSYTDRYSIENCGLCDDEGKRIGGMHRCDHIDHARAAKRGMDLIREAMGWT